VIIFVEARLDPPCATPFVTQRISAAGVLRDHR
jgi:hypothetical protein